MSRHRPPRDDDWQSAAAAAAGAEGDRLAAVLRAAAAPAHPGELAGEAAAMTAFREAAVVTAPSRTSVFRNVLAKVLTVKVVIAVAVAGSAGVVLATTGGVLRAPWSAAPVAEPPPAPTAAPAAPEDRSADTGTSAPPTSAGPDAPSIAELCRAYSARRGPDNKKLDDPGFGPLVAAAGGEDDVAEYCATRTRPNSGDEDRDEDRGGDRGEDEAKHEDKAKDEDEAKDHGRPEHDPPSGKPGKDEHGKKDRGSAPDRPETGKKDRSDTGGTDARPRPVKPSARPQAPGSPAHGAAPAMPPSGAIPPSQGG